MTVQFPPEPEPTPEERVRRARYRELENTLTYIGLAEFEYERDECRAARLWMQDARRSLGALALLSAPASEALAEEVRGTVESLRVALEQILGDGSLPSRREHSNPAGNTALDTIMDAVDDLSQGHESHPRDDED